MVHMDYKNHRLVMIALGDNVVVYVDYKVRSKINETFVIKIFLVAPSVNEIVRWKVICLHDFQ